MCDSRVACLCLLFCPHPSISTVRCCSAFAAHTVRISEKSLKTFFKPSRFSYSTRNSDEISLPTKSSLVCGELVAGRQLELLKVTLQQRTIFTRIFRLFCAYWAFSPEKSINFSASCCCSQQSR